MYEDELKLINLVKANPLLYNKSLQDSHNEEKKAAAWNAIALVMNESGKIFILRVFLHIDSYICQNIFSEKHINFKVTR